MTHIDVHAHCIPRECYELIGERPDARHFIGDMTDVDRRLGDMDRMRIDLQILSAWQGFFNRDLRVAHAFNNALANYASVHPDRFRALAVAPFGEPDTAAEELERAITELNMVGVEIGSNVGGLGLDDARFRPFFAAAARLDTPIFIHPTDPLGKDRLKSFELLNLLGFPTDTAWAAARLVFGGVMQEFPTLRVYLAHGGGVMPFLRGRWDHGARLRGVDAAADGSPLPHLERFWVDAIVHSSDAFGLVKTWLGAGRMMLGSDYPYDMGFSDPLAELSRTIDLSAAERVAISGANANAFFRL